MREIVRLRDEHELLKAIAGMWIKRNWQHALVGDVIFEKEIRSSKGYTFRADVYCELKGGILLLLRLNRMQLLTSAFGS